MSDTIECILAQGGPATLHVEPTELVFDARERIVIPLASIQEILRHDRIVTLMVNRKPRRFTTSKASDAKRAADSIQQAALALRTRGAPDETAKTRRTSRARALEVSAKVLLGKRDLGRGILRLVGDTLSFEGAYKISVDASAIADVDYVEGTPLYVHLRSPIGKGALRSAVLALIVPRGETEWAESLAKAAEREAKNAIGARATIAKSTASEAKAAEAKLAVRASDDA